MSSSYRESALNTIRMTIASLEGLLDKVDAKFDEAVEKIFSVRGRVVVTGMGKSGIIGKKIAATLASTGTPSFFMHPAEAVHGDLGMIVQDDIVLALSNSGETEEILQLLNNLRLRGVPLIAIVGLRESTLARHSDIALFAEIVSEGCPIGCAPMASTTTSLVLGDALSAALMAKRGFKADDFAVFHPKGALGRRLTTTVADLMVKGEALPLVSPDDTMKHLIRVLMDTNLGAVLVVDDKQKLLGLVTDGDMKRFLDTKAEAIFSMKAIDCMTKSPRTINPSKLAERAIREMEDGSKRQITVLPVVDEKTQCTVGLLRIHDIISAKIR